MNAYTEIWEYKVLYKYQALLLSVYNGKKQSWKKTNNEFKAEGFLKTNDFSEKTKYSLRCVHCRNTF